MLQRTDGKLGEKLGKTTGWIHRASLKMKKVKMIGAVVGSVAFVLAQNYLQDLLKLGAGALEGVPLLSQIVSPDRWLLWLGVLFVLSVYHFPTGIVGRLRTRSLAAAPPAP